MSSTTSERTAPEERVRLPMAGLLALFTAGFLGIVNETIPAGLLPEMARGRGVAESVAGQTITAYALATALTAIPLNAVLKRWGRRTVLITALVAFGLANLVTAFLSSFVLILVARLVAGVGAGLIWSNLGGYAARIVPERLQGRAVAIAMAGTPVALSLGLPAGTFLAGVTGWQSSFAVMAAISVGVIVWVLTSLPNIPGIPDGGHVPAATIMRTRGVLPILWVVAGFMVAHNILYTYVAPLTTAAGAGDQLTWVLMVFGLAALLSIWVTGALVNPHHRYLTLLSTLVLGASALVLGLAADPLVLYLAVATWGFGFGGSATLFVTAGIRAAGTDNVQSILVTVFNLSIAAGGVIGGLLLAGPGVASIPWVALAVMVPTVITTVAGRRHAFPHWPRRSEQIG